MSTHHVPLIEIDKIIPHANADTLEIVLIDGWTVVAKKGEFRVGSKAIFVQPDYMVPLDREEFSSLRSFSANSTYLRIRPRKIRGVISHGLLVHPSTDIAALPVGTNLMTMLGIVRYEPVEKNNIEPLSCAEWPKIKEFGKFGLEDLLTYMHLIKSGEMVVLTEKIHGTFGKYVWHDGKLYVGSRNNWLRQEKPSWWSSVAKYEPNIEKWCREHPNTILCGEIYGPVQNYTYGQKKVRFAGFAAFCERWMNSEVLFESLYKFKVPHVPVLKVMPFTLQTIMELAELSSHVPGAGENHPREGIVVTPRIERWSPTIGRIALKYISNRYWLETK